MHTFYEHFTIVFIDNIIKICILLDCVFISSENVNIAYNAYNFIILFSCEIARRGRIIFSKVTKLR